MPFEGKEKRLELFFGGGEGESLRETLTRDRWEKILEPVLCSIEKLLKTKEVDAYLLSASSLFVYDKKIMIKTCGETNLLKCLRGIVSLARTEPVAVKLTRGDYLWPENQPEEHRDFSTECAYLEKHFPAFNNKIQIELGKGDEIFYLFASSMLDDPPCNDVTLEVIMMDLDPKKSFVFFHHEGCTETMTRSSGIDYILPGSDISDFEFTPCGYSMNGILGDAVFTIHVTPEEAFSFASFEISGRNHLELNQILARVLKCFDPAKLIAVLHTKKEDQEDLIVEGRPWKSKEVKTTVEWGTISYYSS